MAIAQVAILVQRFQWFDGVFVDFLQILQRFVGNLLKGFVLSIRFFIQVENLVDVATVAKVFGNFRFLAMRLNENNPRQPPI